MRIYNTLSRQLEEFKPLSAHTISIYCCGPTVYDYTHLGHLFKYAMDDTIVRSLRYLGYKVTHVMNITDVGHLVSDEDAGEDKLEKGARKTGKTVWEVAEFYTDFFNRSMRDMNVNNPDVVCKATEHIPEMINLLRILEEKGYTYTTDEAVYFDTSKFASYGALSGQKLEEKRKAVRDEVVEDSQKKHHADFALWFKRVGRFADHTMHWESPWGDGFPGWHIECSAMSMKYLGPRIDIHTGGVDHIPVHHTNEIAQSEAATGETPFVSYWMHHNFLKIEGEKMSKSLGNFFTLEDIRAKGFEPAALRLLFLQSHYRTEMNFTWEALKSAQNALHKLKAHYYAESESVTGSLNVEPYKQAFSEALKNDFSFAQAVSIVWKSVKEIPASPERRNLMTEFLQVLGVDMGIKSPHQAIPESIIEKANARALAKKQEDFKTADALRKEVEKRGFRILDEKDGTFRVVPV